MGQNNQKDQKGPKMRAAVMLVQNKQNNQKIWSLHISHTILKVRFFWDTLYICQTNLSLPRTKAACIRSKVGTSMLSVIWLAASLILARPQVARPSSSGSLGDGAIIPRSSTRPEISNLGVLRSPLYQLLPFLLFESISGW